jgi:DNA-directed RNA polymerase subunit RPC12/RpoP
MIKMNTVVVKRLKITPETRRLIMERDGFSCRYCGSKKEPFHLDHVYPVAKGGETTVENLVTACANCNHRKSAKVVFPKPIGYFDKEPKPVRLWLNVWIFVFLLIAVLLESFYSFLQGNQKMSSLEFFLSIFLVFIILILPTKNSFVWWFKKVWRNE